MATETGILTEHSHSIFCNKL